MVTKITVAGLELSVEDMRTFPFPVKPPLHIPDHFGEVRIVAFTPASVTVAIPYGFSKFEELESYLKIMSGL